jgi:hypothetical protein
VGPIALVLIPTLVLLIALAGHRPLPVRRDDHRNR